jgi:catechol 2,3-dioxygenase-like lactoylglutathione lyase family enzyme
MAARIDLTLDCAEVAKLAEFWKLALGYPAGAGPRLSLLEVPEPKTAKNRLHIDIRVADRRRSPAEQWATITAEVARLTAAGATVLTQDGQHHVVMADPEGNEFCVA